MKRESPVVLADLLAPRRGMRSVMARRIEGPEPGAAQECCWVVVEQALRVEVAEVGSYTLMSTPTGSAGAAGYLAQDGVLGVAGEPGDLALAAGFLFTEGIIKAMGEVESMAVCPDDPAVVKVKLLRSAGVQSARRSGLVTSSCGMCGNVDSLEAAFPDALQVGRTRQVSAAQVHRYLLAMQQQQFIFAATGGTHAAALFDAHDHLLAVAEDLGRHNALDKVIGHCLLHAQASAAGCVVLSGRVSLEMIVKAARAGIELVAAVSAPSSLAIAAAQRVGITLCGFVRGQRLTAYTHADRLGIAT
ncbi:MAG: formate dehydrogenase accessory sulfurtransferase FdhD [Rhodoferax sp.]|uniref:formate dehydrogenase accessory sulfurtransferase FdhD n=1 Tax=Rhodoferax sp. TaxID=50421 RepID=UPI0026264350|nr:formate dehydrogenase accessory sulfurtransferase FdhD [Rhodoferax sp.]MDD5334105.1 formate dehydrogenase accessory sulfurtransferase FdhD [Rhodoferax sp.]